MAAVRVGTVWAVAGVEVAGAVRSDTAVITAEECGPVGVVSAVGVVGPGEVAGADGAATVLVAAGVDGRSEWRADWQCR